MNESMRGLRVDGAGGDVCRRLDRGYRKGGKGVGDGGEGGGKVLKRVLKAKEKKARK
jgi:hypothetical protein